MDERLKHVEAQLLGMTRKLDEIIVSVHTAIGKIDAAAAASSRAEADAASALEAAASAQADVRAWRQDWRRAAWAAGGLVGFTGWAATWLADHWLMFIGSGK